MIYCQIWLFPFVKIAADLVVNTAHVPQCHFKETFVTGPVMMYFVFYLFVLSSPRALLGDSQSQVVPLGVSVVSSSSARCLQSTPKFWESSKELCTITSNFCYLDASGKRFNNVSDIHSWESGTNAHCIVAINISMCARDHVYSHSLTSVWSWLWNESNVFCSTKEC